MTRRPLRPNQPFAARVALVAATLSVAVAACSTFTGVPASLTTITDSGVVYALNGAPPGAPTALHLISGSRLAADANFFFDVAFDIDSTGRAVILPQRAVASGLSTTHTVGLQVSDTTFDAIGKAPKSGYRADTALVARVGQVVLVQNVDQSVCGISITGTTIYAKVVITALDVKARQLTIRYTIDPNCGFLSFASGVPKE